MVVEITTPDADAPNPSTQQYTVDFYIDRSPPSTANGTAISTTVNGVKTAIYKSSTHFDLNLHDVRAVIRGVDSSGAISTPHSNTLSRNSVLPCQVTCTTDRPVAGSAYPPTAYKLEPNQGSQTVYVHIRNNGITNIPVNLERVDVHFPSKAAPPAPFDPGDSIGPPLGTFPITNQPMYNYVTGSQGAQMTVIRPGEIATFASASFSVVNFPHGVYPILVRFGGIDFTPTCGSFVIGYAPYMKVFGGDIFAGTRLGASDDNINCPGWGIDLPLPFPNSNQKNDGLIYAQTTGNRGASSNLGVFALNEIEGFLSAGQRYLGIGAPLPPRGLTFNNVSSPNGRIGFEHCPYDYFGNRLPNGVNGTVDKSGALNRFNAAATSTWISNLSGSSKGSYIFNTSGTPLLFGSQNILNGSSCIPTVAPPRDINLYVDGDVRIAGNIQYQPEAPTCANRVPRFRLIVRGNIYVHSNVTRLDGVYIAQPRSGVSDSGTFNTCRNVDGSTVNYRGDNPGTHLYGECRNQLVINGGVLAYRSKWLRTFGSLRNAQAEGHLEFPGTSTPPSVPPAPFSACENRGTLADNGPQGPSLANICAAEIIIQSPQAYLSRPPTTADSFATTYDYISSLPPLL